MSMSLDRLAELSHYLPDRGGKKHLKRMRRHFGELAQVAYDNQFFVASQTPEFPSQPTYTDLVRTTDQQIMQSDTGEKIKSTIHSGLEKEIVSIEKTIGRKEVSRRTFNLANNALLGVRRVQGVIRNALEEKQAKQEAIPDARELRTLIGIPITPETQNAILHEIQTNPERIPKGKLHDLFYLLTQGLDLSSIAYFFDTTVPFIKIQINNLYAFFQNHDVPQEMLFAMYPSVERDITLSLDDFIKIPHKETLTTFIEKDGTVDSVLSDEYSLGDLTTDVFTASLQMYRAKLSLEEIQQAFPYFFQDTLSLPQDYLASCIEQNTPSRFIKHYSALYESGEISKKDKELDGAKLRDIIKYCEQIDTVTLFVRYPALLPTLNAPAVSEETLLTETQTEWLKILEKKNAVIEDLFPGASLKFLSKQNVRTQLTKLVSRFVQYGRLPEISYMQKFSQFTSLFASYEQAHKEMEYLLKQKPPVSPTAIFTLLSQNPSYAELALSEEICARWIISQQQEK